MYNFYGINIIIAFDDTMDNTVCVCGDPRLRCSRYEDVDGPLRPIR